MERLPLNELLSGMDLREDEGFSLQVKVFLLHFRVRRHFYNTMSLSGACYYTEGNHNSIAAGEIGASRGHRR